MENGMELERLSEFLQICNTGTIKEAAKQIGISPATLSARLSGFERQMGTKLFCRGDGGKLKLTEAGRQLMPGAQEILDQFQQLRLDMRRAQDYMKSRLRIAVTGSSLPVYLGPFLDRLNLIYPEVQLELLDDSQFDIAQGLESGQVDVYFAPVMDDFSPGHLQKVPFVPACQYVVLPASHPLAERNMIFLRELAGERFLLYPQTAEPSIREFQLRNLQSSGIEYHVYDSATASAFYKLLVPVGKGILLLPSHMMNIPPNSVCIPLGDLKHPATFCFFYDPQNPSPHVQAFARDFPAFIKEMTNHQYYTFA